MVLNVHTVFKLFASVNKSHINTKYLYGVYICIIDYIKDSYYFSILLYLFL